MLYIIRTLLYFMCLIYFIVLNILSITRYSWHFVNGWSVDPFKDFSSLFTMTKNKKKVKTTKIKSHENNVWNGKKKYEKMKVKLLLKLIFHAQYFPLYALQFTLYNNLLHFLFIFSFFFSMENNLFIFSRFYFYC